MPEEVHAMIEKVHTVLGNVDTERNFGSDIATGGTDLS